MFSAGSLILCKESSSGLEVSTPGHCQMLGSPPSQFQATCSCVPVSVCLQEFTSLDFLPDFWEVHPRRPVPSWGLGLGSQSPRL
jgi:hypothetical protein